MPNWTLSYSFQSSTVIRPVRARSGYCDLLWSAADQESEDDIFEIVGAVSRITAKYRQLGIGLGLLPGKIDEIEKKRKTSSSVRDKLSEVITLRLDQLPAPTWKTFIDAAKPINPALAESMCTKKKYGDELEISTHYCCMNGFTMIWMHGGGNLEIISDPTPTNILCRYCWKCINIIYLPTINYNILTILRCFKLLGVARTVPGDTTLGKNSITFHCSHASCVTSHSYYD